MELDRELLETFLFNHETENSLDRIVGMSCVKALPNGENYTSVIWRVTLDVLLKSGRRTKRRVIVKDAVTSGHHGQFLRDHGLFKREIEAYENILKQMQTVMEAHGDYREMQWPELIGSHSDTLVVLEDLSAKGYKTINRKEMLDLPHVLLLVAELGRFHATGLVLLEKGLTDKTKFTIMEFSREQLFQSVFLNTLKAFGRAVDTSWGSEWQEAAKRIKISTNLAYDKFSELVQIDPQRFNVINHGDCWSNNVMFQWDHLNRPLRIKFVDFQLIHYNSFALDLTHLVYCSTQGEVRRSHFDDIIKMYRNSVLETVELYGLTTKVPSQDEMKQEMNRLRFFAFMLLGSIHPIVTGDGVALDMEKLTDNTMDPSEAINLEIFTSDKFKKNVTNDILAFMEEGVI